VREERPVTSFPGESVEYHQARNQLLPQEIELRRITEAVASARRALPSGGVVPDDLAVDLLAWRVVAAMFDRERLVTGTRT
jgi:predicted dithiol-disulfide oxidoreductase (DUF899 family)